MADQKTDERLLDTDIGEQEYNELKDKFIVIPPGRDNVEHEGDLLRVTVEAGTADWKQPGKSLVIPLTVIDPGINQGKTIEWYAGISKDAMGITKRALRAFGIEDKVLRRSEGKIKINPLGFAGGRALALFRRELSSNNNLIAKLDSTAFLPVPKQSPDVPADTPQSNLPF